MRPSNSLLFLLLILAVLTWYFALHPQQFDAVIQRLRGYPQPSKPPVTCAHLLATMERTYDRDLYDFVCFAHWTGEVELSIGPVLSRSNVILSDSEGPEPKLRAKRGGSEGFQEGGQ